jgi:hypothetical protein
MTTLQSFQAEIEDIRTRELARTRVQVQPEALKRGHVDHKSAPKVRKKATGDTGPPSPVTPTVTRDESVQDISDLEHSFQVRQFLPLPIRHFHLWNTIQSALISSPDEGNTEARDLISTLLTQQGGEYLLRIGARPPRAPLYANEGFDSADGWTGDERTEAEIDIMIDRTVQLVEEVGGKVHFQHTRSSSLQALILSSGLRPIPRWRAAPPSFRSATIASTRRVSHTRGTMCGGWEC